jgi:putative transposase
VTFAFIRAEKAAYPVQVLCQALAVSRSGFYAWQARRSGPRAAQDWRLRHAIRVAHAESAGRYGSPRILHVVRAQGHTVGRNRVMRLMRADGLWARRRRRFRVTTDSAHHWRPAPDLVQRRFRPTAPNQIWAADVTYVSTAEGWAYLAVLLDLYSRRVVGWAMRSTLQNELVVAAFRHACARRPLTPGLVHHSDRGLQYASSVYQQLLAAHGVRVSMSRRGNCWDNAVVESFFSTLKQELETSQWPTRAAATTAIGHYIDHFYNPVRLHSTLAYQSPNVFEAAAVL